MVSRGVLSWSRAVHCGGFGLLPRSDAVWSVVECLRAMKRIVAEVRGVVAWAVAET